MGTDKAGRGVGEDALVGRSGWSGRSFLLGQGRVCLVGSSRGLLGGSVGSVVAGRVGGVESVSRGGGLGLGWWGQVGWVEWCRWMGRSGLESVGGGSQSCLRSFWSL